MQRPLLRRDLLKHLGLSIVVGTALGRMASAQEVCADPKKLDSGAVALLASLNYAELSPDPAKTCSACAFFTAAGTCGQCQIVSGPTNAKGHCDSWGPK